MQARYQFRPLAAGDLPLVKEWLEAPHVAQWWGDADEQFALVSGDLEHPAMNQFIVTHDGRPFAYVQGYDPGAWPVAALGPQPAGTRGIDQFIGEADMRGHGHGSAFIRCFIDCLLARGAPRVNTDPDPDNKRAIRAYEKAGFHAERVMQTLQGRALLMVCDA